MEIRRTDEERSAAEGSSAELALLCRAAGLTPVGTISASIRRINPATLLGSGTVETITQSASERDAGVIVFDTALLPRQQRNLEKITGRVVTDRPAVILEIFARRATTREAKLQVELARVEYDLPRLAGKWQHLSRQGGGSRLARGEGETQLEVDRRIVLRKASTIRNELARVEAQRHLRRKRRETLFRASLIGYTNAGKSTLLNSLTGARTYAANQLFATLDPSSRRFQLAGHAPVVCTDTVGFVRRLPHALIKAFHSTLEEAVESDLRLFVVDASNPEASRHLSTAFEVVEELGGIATDSLVVLNKIDRCANPEAVAFAVHALRPEFETVRVSAKTGQGVSDLRAMISERADAATRP